MQHNLKIYKKCLTKLYFKIGIYKISGDIDIIQKVGRISRKIVIKYRFVNNIMINIYLQEICQVYMPVLKNTNYFLNMYGGIFTPSKKRF